MFTPRWGECSGGKFKVPNLVHAGIPRMGYGHLDRPWIGICVILDGNIFGLYNAIEIFTDLWPVF